MAAIHVRLGEIDWAAIAAVATLGLAGMTWWLARSTQALARQTRRLANETTKLATETNQDVAAAFRPVLTAREALADGIISEDATGRWHVGVLPVVLNDGHGPALNCRWTSESGTLDMPVGADGEPQNYERANTSREWQQNTLRVGEAAQIQHTAEPNDPNKLAQRFIFRLLYEDIGGNEHTTLLIYKAESLKPDRNHAFKAILVATLIDRDGSAWGAQADLGPA